MKEQLTFVTGNLAKVEWLKRYISFPITHQTLEIPEIQTLDLAEVVSQ